MFLGSRRGGGFLRPALQWLTKSPHVLRRGFSAQPVADGLDHHWLVDESVPGFNQLWSKIEVQHPGVQVVDAVNEWKDQGQELTNELLRNILYKLRGRGWYSPAQRLAAWADNLKLFELTEEDKLLRLDILCQLRNSRKQLPKVWESFECTSEVPYIIILKAYLAELQRESAEKIFQQLKESKLMVTGRAHSIMLRMYGRLEQNDKALEIFSEYEASGFPLEASIYSYLIQNRETVFSSIPVDQKLQAALKTLTITRANRSDMLRLYAHLGDAEEVDRIWEQVLANPPVFNREYLAAISSYDVLGDVSKAEELSEMYGQSYGSDVLSYNQGLAMLRLYARHGKLDKALEFQAELLSRRVHFQQVHPIIDAYLKAGDLQQAVECFHSYMSLKHQWRMPWRLIGDSIVKMNTVFAETGDVKSAEKLMALAPKLKYIAAYKSLMKVYLSAKTPAYGIRDRMLAANVAVDDEAKSLLEQLDALGAENDEPAAAAAAERD